MTISTPTELQNVSQDTTDPLLWAIKDILRECSMPRTNFWRIRRSGKFPPKVQLPENTARWYSAEVKVWVKSHQHLINHKTE